MGATLSLQYNYFLFLIASRSPMPIMASKTNTPLFIASFVRKKNKWLTWYKKNGLLFVSSFILVVASRSG
jgi:hypothetical protein